MSLNRKDPRTRRPRAVAEQLRGQGLGLVETPSCLVDEEVLRA